MPEYVPTDMRGLDETLVKMPTDLLADLAEAGKNDLYAFNNGILGYKDMTPACHGPLCSFFQHNPKQFKRGLMPRDHFKSSVITIGGTLWKIVRNPDERIHIKNEKIGNASRFLTAIKTHATSGKIFRTLYGQFVPPDPRKVRWNDEEADFLGRSGVYPEPTISVSGMTSATTSNHFSHIMVDDPISEAAVHSELVMQEAIQRMKGFIPLLTKPLLDTIWIIGTRWAYHDVYSFWDGAYGEMTAKFSRAAIENGKPIFPELISLEMLDMKRRADEYLFSCIYMNNPRNTGIQDMDVQALRYWTYTDATERKIAVYDQRTNEILTVVDVARLDITATVDLAPAEKTTSDRNAVTVVGVDPTKGYVIVLDSWAERCTPMVLIEHLFYIHKRWDIRKLGIENVAYQAAFKYFLKQECDRRMVHMNVVPVKSTNKKEVRIKGLQPMIKMGRMAVHPTHQILKNEMSEFPLGEHDDVIDSLSMHLQIASGWFSPERVEQFLKAEKQMLAQHGIYRSPVDVPIEESEESEIAATVGKWNFGKSHVLG
jgi:predicted phage terminase large subunit-like protein